MSKDQIVSDAKASLVSGQDLVLSQVLGSVYDLAAQEQKASDGTLSQGDLDAAVAAAVAPLNQQISDLSAKDAADLQLLSDAQAKLADLSAKFDVLVAKEGIEAGIVAEFQASLAGMQKVVADLIGLQPAPVPPVA